MRKGIGAVVLVLLALGVLVYGASEWSGEVVRLATFDDAGARHETPLWIVEDEGRPWLRAGQPTSGWLLRLERHPEVEVVRNGRVERYRAVPVADPERRARINALMAERYGWGDRLIGVMRDPEVTVPVRLDPLDAPDTGASG